MKKLLKSDICGSHEQYTGPTDVIKGQKSKKSVDTVLSPTAADKKKKRKKKDRRKRKSQNATHVSVLYKHIHCKNFFFW